MFDAIVNIDWINEGLVMFLTLGAGFVTFVLWVLLSSIIQASLFVQDKPMRYWSNPLKDTGNRSPDDYKGIFNLRSSCCDSEDKTVDLFCMLSASYVFVYALLILNYIWLPVIIIGGVIAGLFGTRAIVRLKKALSSHIADKNAHKGDE